MIRFKTALSAWVLSAALLTLPAGRATEAGQGAPPGGKAASEGGLQRAGAGESPQTPSTPAQTSTLPTPAASSGPRLDLVTMGPGDDLFVRVGHAVICIVPSGKPWHEGTCYNWGQTDFSSTPRVIQRYLLGTSVFWATATSYGRVYDYYANRVDRTFYVQTLDVPADAIRKLDQKLRLEVMPRFREYEYHHLKANCSSKVRDRLDEALGGALKQGSDMVPMPPTWRDWARTYLAGDPLMMTAAELAGPALDGVPSEWDAMALPDVLREVVARKLKVPPQELHTRSAPLVTGSMAGGKLTLGLIGLGLLGLAFLAGRSRQVRLARRAEVGVAVGLGLAGLVAWGLVAVSALDETKGNLLPLLWMPLDGALPWLKPDWRVRYLSVRLVVIVGLVGLGLVGVVTQPMMVPGLLAALPLGILWREGRRRTAKGC